MIVVPLEEQAREQLRLGTSVSGVLVANLQKQSKPFIGGIRPYDVITEINGKNIETLMDFYKAVNDPSTEEYKIGFIRDGSKFFIGISKE